MICRRSGEIGRRRGLKIPRPLGHVGSIPTSGIEKCGMAKIATEAIGLVENVFSWLPSYVIPADAGIYLFD